MATARVLFVSTGTSRDLVIGGQRDRRARAQPDTGVSTGLAAVRRT